MALQAPELTPKLKRMPPGLRRNLLLKRMEQLRRRAPTSLEAHGMFVHRNDADEPLRAYDHHAEWCRVLEDRINYPWLGIVAPPGYAKTTWGSWVYPAWRIGQTNGAIRIGLVANTANLSWGLAGAIRETIESPFFQAAYPDARPDYKRGWRHNEFYLEATPQGKDPCLAAMGVSGPVQSRRFDEIILDDPTKFEQAQSQVEMQKQQRWLKNTLLKRLPAGLRPPSNPEGRARVVVVFTRWGPNDLHDTLVDMGFHILHMPALGFWDAEEDEDGRMFWGSEPLWPEAENYDYLKDLREKDELTFELVMQGNPNVLTGDLFDPEWWAERRGRPPLREDFERVITFIDTSSGKDAKKGDFFAAATVGKIGTDVWILDVFRGRLNAMQQEDQAIRLFEEHKPDLLVVEAVNEGEALAQRLIARHDGIPVSRFSPVKDKAFRAAPLAGAYRQGHVWHAYAPWNMAYEAELASFPGGPHDDQVDAASGAYSNLTSSGVRIATAG